MLLLFIYCQWFQFQCKVTISHFFIRWVRTKVSCAAWILEVGQNNNSEQLRGINRMGELGNDWDFVVNILKVNSCLILKKFLKNFSLRKKCSYSEFFWFPFPRIQSECGKIQARITPNTDTFHAVSNGIMNRKIFFWY